MSPRLPARSLAGRLDAIEQAADSRRLMRTYRLADGGTARLSTFDVLAALRTGLALDYAERHDDPHPADPPPAVVRTLATLDTSTHNSVLDNLVQQVSAAWCAAYDTPGAAAC